MAKITIKKDLQDVEENKFIAALSYIWIISLFVLLFKRNSAFAQFHAKQGTAIFILEAISIFFGPLVFIPVILAIFLSFKGVKASLEGKYWILPLAGEWIINKKI